jgi:hypothetical protein
MTSQKMAFFTATHSQQKRPNVMFIAGLSEVVFMINGSASATEA